MNIQRIRRHSHQLVKQNFWKIILITILVAIITGVISSIFSSNVLLMDGLSYSYQPGMRELPMVVGNFANYSGPMMFYNIITTIITPLITVGVVYWMTLHMSDTGRYDINEWFATYGRNTGPAFLNVIVYNVIRSIAVFIATVIAGLGFILLAAALIAPSFSNDLGSGYMPLTAIAILSALLLIFIFALYPLFFYIEFLFTMPNFIVYDIKGISFGDVWKLNRTIHKGRFWDAFRLIIWYILVLAAAILVYIVVGALIMAGLGAMSGGMDGVILSVFIIYAILGFLVAVLFLIPFNVARQTSWASFYREAMKERQAEIEAEFPLIDFGTLFQQGIPNSQSSDSIDSIH